MSYDDNTTPSSNPLDESEARELMCEIGRRIWQRGYCAANDGNHSCRFGPNRFLCTPTGMSKGFMKPQDMCVVDADGNQLAGQRKRSSEFLLHAAIYKARPDVNAVVHSHAPHATAFAVAGVELPARIHPEAEYTLGPVRLAPYSTPGGQGLADSIAPFVRDSYAILLSNHGVVCFHPDMEGAYHVLEVVDSYARLVLLAKQVGSIKPLSSQNVAELLRMKTAAGLRDPRATEPTTPPNH